MFSGLVSGVPTRHIRTGCYDTHEDGNWHPCPLSSELDEYQNWKEGRPKVNVSTHCAVFAKNNNNGNWIDDDCKIRRYVICERTLQTTASIFCLQTGSDGHIKSQCRIGHVMKKLRADGVVLCGKTCRSEPRCRSFNLLISKPIHWEVEASNEETQLMMSQASDMWNTDYRLDYCMIFRLFSQLN